jgi:uncharacterized membrane protein YkvA (DUF1232 family)
MAGTTIDSLSWLDAGGDHSVEAADSGERSVGERVQLAQQAVHHPPPRRPGETAPASRNMTRIGKLRQRARRLRAETTALWLCARDPRTPRIARLLVAVVVAYALSPIDLIPDFVPVLGYLDDLIVIPLGIALAIRMVPRAVLEESRTRAEQQLRSGRPASWAAAAAIATIWVVALVLCAFFVYRAFRAR